MRKRLNQLEAMWELIIRKKDEGMIDEAEFATLLAISSKQAEQSGPQLANDPSLLPVARHSLFLLRQAVLEMHPELRTEMSKIDEARQLR